jgi:hypothetical protein
MILTARFRKCGKRLKSQMCSSGGFGRLERRTKVKAKDILTDQSRWTQGAAARDRWGETCKPSSPEAAAFCVLGAIYRAYSEKAERAEAARRVVEAIVSLGWKCRGSLAIGGWNDYPSRKFEDVRRVLEKADV